MTYEIRFIYLDYKVYSVYINEEDIIPFFECMSSSKPFMHKSGEKGFWISPSCIRGCYILKRSDVESSQNKEDTSCHENQSSEAESDLPA